MHHDLWDMDPSAAPQLTTIRHNGRNRDVVAVTGKTGWLYVFDRVTGEPIWPIEERPVPKSEMPGEQSWPTQPYPTNPPPFIKHTFGVDDISPYLPPDEAETFRKRLLAANNKGIFTPISYDGHGARSDEQRRHAVRRRGVRAAHRRRLRRRARQPGHPASAAARRRTRRRRRRAAAAARAGRVSAELPDVPRRRSAGHRTSASPLVHATADPANNIAAGAPRFDAAAIRDGHRDRQRRMPAFPHLTSADVDNLVTFLTTPAVAADAVRARSRADVVAARRRAPAHRPS